ncbi:hypothetical protein M404DRAFT_730643 [Pisolithus tinctorius Marx 270]|uniref:Uncharacterized protein n=1 Tax=Pisolithus tinctorius Marx 270 TaxID=870435 RepID=A0A0C3P246_PISTI|nr:hypothetical protein M404DRAFT_730643 [Pisolithus tinctorius Marx 270]
MLTEAGSKLENHGRKRLRFRCSYVHDAQKNRQFPGTRRHFVSLKACVVFIDSPSPHCTLRCISRRSAEQACRTYSAFMEDIDHTTRLLAWRIGQGQYPSFNLLLTLRTPYSSLERRAPPSRTLANNEGSRMPSKDMLLLSQSAAVQMAVRKPKILVRYESTVPLPGNQSAVVSRRDVVDR